MKNYSFEEFLTEHINPNEKKRKLCVSDVPVYLKTINGISKIVWQVSLFCGETRLSPFLKNQTRKNEGFGRWEFSLEIFCTRLTPMSTNGQVRSFCIYKTTFITITFDFKSVMFRVFWAFYQVKPSTFERFRLREDFFIITVKPQSWLRDGIFSMRIRNYMLA